MGMQMTGGNGILSIPAEHVPGLIALIAFPLAAWCVIAAIRAGANRGYRPFAVVQARLDSLSFEGRVTLVALLVGAVVHAAIIPTHWGDSRVLALLFVVDVVGFLAASAWLVLQRPHWRVVAFGMLVGTAAGYVFYALKGWETPDPVGMITTAVELTAGLVLLMPAAAVSATPMGRRWTLMASIPIAAITVLGAAVLSGAPSASEVQAGATVTRTGMPSMSSHSHSTTPSVGTMPSMSSTQSTQATSSMPSMSSAPSAQPGGAMPAMNGATGAPSSAGAMPSMTATSTGSSTGMPSSATGMPGPSPSPMPGMPGMESGGSGSGNGGVISLATDSRAGPITWPLTMGSMGAGMQMVTPNCTTSPTAEQQQAAVALVNQTVSAVSRYQSLANARADGYVPITPTGQSLVHYAKPSNIDDGALLDPNAIESLVYANTPNGAILVAAMYLMASDQVGASPPMPGGCLTEWHIHTNLCFSNSNGTVVGVTHAGACAAGSTNHISQPMIHVWLAPVPGGPLVVDATDAQAVQAAEQLPIPSPQNPTA
jgi:hypothetical protein